MKCIYFTANYNTSQYNRAVNAWQFNGSIPDILLFLADTLGKGEYVVTQEWGVFTRPEFDDKFLSFRYIKLRYPVKSEYLLDKVICCDGEIFLSSSRYENEIYDAQERLKQVGISEIVKQLGVSRAEAEGTFRRVTEKALYE